MIGLSYNEQLYNMLFETQQARDNDNLDFGFVKEGEKFINPYDPAAQHFEPFQHDYGRYPDSFKKFEKSFTKYQEYKDYFQATPQEYPKFIEEKEYNTVESFFKRKF